MCCSAAIRDYQRLQDAEAVQANWFPVEFAGHTWAAANNTAASRNGEFFKAIRGGQHESFLEFAYCRHDWVIALWSFDERVDCGAIAAEHGGGGRPWAAGFHCKELPFELGD